MSHRRLLGEGRSARVWEMPHPTWKSVACKEGPPVEALRREHEALTRCAHGGVVRSYGLAGEALLLEIIEASDAHGTDAFEWVRGRPPVVEENVPRRNLPVAFGYDQQEEGESAYVSCGPVGYARLRVMIDALAASLRAVHAAGYVHLDVCGDNVLVEQPSERVVLIDFDLARPLADGAQSGMSFAGRAAHIAPELGRGEVSPANDWYGLGVLAFEAASGQLPFIGGGGEVLVRKQSLEAPRLSTVLEDVPPDLDELVAGLLKRSPQTRLRL